MLLPGQVMGCTRGRVPGGFEVAETDRSRGILVKSSGVSGVVFRCCLRRSGVFGGFVFANDPVVAAAGARAFLGGIEEMSSPNRLILNHPVD